MMMTTTTTTTTTTSQWEEVQEKHNDPAVPSGFAVFYHDTSQAAGNHSLSVSRLGKSELPMRQRQQRQHGELALYYHYSHGETV
jgi:hypothetical protein